MCRLTLSANGLALTSMASVVVGKDHAAAGSGLPPIAEYLLM
jgi:hypothetical protein